MSDGHSDLQQDQNILKEFERLMSVERGLKKDKYSLDALVALAKGWSEYALMRGGYNTIPAKRFAHSRISEILSVVEGRAPYEKFLDKINAPPRDGEHFYRAVGGHGGLMSTNEDLESIVKEALQRRYGRRVDSFRILIGEKGELDFEEVTCKNCPLVGSSRCHNPTNMNCYRPEEYFKILSERKKGRETLEELAPKYGIKFV